MRQIVILACLLFYTTLSRAIIVGSNTAPSRPALTTFPAVDSDNEMRGFAAFENGFTLADGSTTCIFNSFFPISGTITLNSGTLTLSRDLVLNNSVSLANGGTINGNSYAIDFPDKTGSFSLGGATTFNSVNIFLHSDLTLSGAATFGNTCVVDGNGYAIDFTSGSISVAAGANLTIKNAVLKNITAGDISCVNSASTLTLQDIVWIQSGNYTFSQGAITISNLVKMTGPYIFTYTSGQTSTIQADATWLFDSGMTFSYDPTSASNLIAMTDSTSILHLYETTLFATAVGLDLTKGTLVVEGECPVESDATIQADGINFGDGALASNDITLKPLAESGLKINSGFLVYKNMS